MRKITTDPVPWVVGLFAANFVLQRFSIPNLNIPIITPLVLGWLALLLWAGVAEINARRLVLWLLASSVSGSLVILQVLFVSSPFVSANSWAFWVVIWLPLVLHFRDRRRQTFERSMRGVANVGLGIGALSIVFMATQLIGVSYRDWLSEMVPPDLLIGYFNTSYPVAYGSALYKSNAWLALEPSFLSFTLGVCLVAAVIVRLHWAKAMVIFIGMAASAAGSGFAVVVAFIILSLLFGQGRRLRPYAVPGIVIGVLLASTLVGEAILARVTEAGASRSSTSLRAIEAYVRLWPDWTADPLTVILGRGPGSSAWVVSNLGVDGMLVPNPAKVLFDYGIFGGTLLLLVMVSAFIRTPEPALAWALAASMFTIQTAAPGLVVCVLLTASLWAPTLSGRRYSRPSSRCVAASSGQWKLKRGRSASPPELSVEPSGSLIR